MRTEWMLFESFEEQEFEDILRHIITLVKGKYVLVLLSQ
jgi:hypothetical protein